MEQELKLHARIPFTVHIARGRVCMYHTDESRGSVYSEQFVFISLIAKAMTQKHSIALKSRNFANFETYFAHFKLN